MGSKKMPLIDTQQQREFYKMSFFMVPSLLCAELVMCRVYVPSCPDFGLGQLELLILPEVLILSQKKKQKKKTIFIFQAPQEFRMGLFGKEPQKSPKEMVHFMKFCINII